MNRSLPVIVLSLAGASPAIAGGIELNGFAGVALPTYSQTFRYEPTTVVPIPGLSVTQSGTFTVDTESGFAGAGSAAWHFAGPLGIEARFDFIDAGVSVSDARYDVVAQLPPPLPPVSAGIDLEPGSASVAHLKPLSLNLRLRTDGPVRLHVSGGVSYLPDFEASIVQRVGLGVTGVLPGGQLEVATLGIKAEAVASEPGDEGKLGLNAGLGISIGGTLSFVAEGRVFVFEERHIEWSAAAPPANAIEALLLNEVLRQLPEVEFNPVTFQVLAGLSLRF
jgi:hypothetical protein